MDVASVAHKLGVRDAQLIAKGKELVRLSALKIPGGLGQGEVCKAAACLELACSTTTHVQAPSRDDFVRHSCASKKVYLQAFVMLQKALSVVPSMGIPQLVVRFGVEPLAKPAEALLSLYRSRFMMDVKSHMPSPVASHRAGTDSSQQMMATASASQAAPITDFSHPVFAVAALHLTAVRAADLGSDKPGKRGGQVKLQVPKVLKALDISNAHFQHTVDSMKQLCAAELGVQQAEGKEEDAPPPGKRGRTTRQASATGDADGSPATKKAKKGRSRGKRKADKKSSDEGDVSDDSGDGDDAWQVVG